MLSATLCFALMGAVVKEIGTRYSGFELLAFRGLVGMLVLGFWIIRTAKDLGTQYPGAHLGRSLVGTISILAFYYSLVNLPLATSLTLNYTSPLFITAFLLAGGGLVATRQWRYLIPYLLPIISGFIGVILILQPTVARQDLGGMVAGLSGGALGAVAYLLVKSLGRRGEPEWKVVFYFSLTNAVVGTLLASIDGWHRLTGPDLGLIVLAALLALAGQLMMTRAFGQGRTLVAAALQYSGIVFASIIGLVWFHERLDLLEILGIVVIAGSGLAATLLSGQQDQNDAKTAGGS